MEAGFERWIGDADGFRDFSVIQYGKGLFPSSIPVHILHTFCRDFPNTLRRWQQSLRMGLSPHRRFRNPDESDCCVVEMRMGGGWRLHAIFTAGRVTLLDASNQEEQRARMRSLLEDREWVLEHGEELEGFRQRPAMEFLRLLYLHLVRRKWQCSAETFRIVFQEGLNVILDDVQMDVVESSDYLDVARLFLLGAAGTGKTMTGVRWLADHRIQDADRILLSLSEAQSRLHRRRWEQENAVRRELGQPLLPNIRHQSAFDFLLEHVRPYMEKGEQALDADGSYALFREICNNLPSVYWKPIPGSDAIGKSFLLWQEIHGMIKGALFRRDFSHGNAPLSKEQYGALKSFHSGRGEGSRPLMGQAITVLFRLYERYEKHRQERRLLDDNDIARLALAHLDEIRQSEGFRRYGLAFLDDCQELTEIQQLALHSLLSDCAQMLMAADLSQMLHPTWFHMGFAQQLAERMAETEGEVSSQRWLLANQHRCTFDISSLLNGILEEIGADRSFGEGGISPAKPGLHDMGDGALPLWIVDTPRHRELLQALIEETDGSVRPLRAFCREGDANGLALSDLRGLGAPAVLLLWNVFREAADCVGESAAWSYFYAAAARAERCLLILETDQGAVGEFLDQMLEDGAIEKCSALEELHDGKESWLDEIRSWAGQASAADTRVLRLFLHGQYDQALELCRRPSASEKQEQMALACEGKLAEEKGELESALKRYMELAGRSKDGKCFIEELLEHPELPKEMDLAARLCFLGDAERGFGGGSGLQDIYEAYREKGGARGMEELLEELGQRYPAVRKQLRKWTDGIMDGMALQAASILNVADMEASWRQELHE